jgi:hypothetical protein
MSLWRIGRFRCGLIQATIAALVLSQVSAGPALAQVMVNGAVTTGAGALAAQRAAEETPAKAAAPGTMEPMSDIERQGYGCLLGGGAATVFSVLGGPTETILVVAGGMLIPTNRVVLWTALSGTVIAAVCAASALATPAVLRLWDYYYVGLRPAPQQ